MAGDTIIFRDTQISSRAVYQCNTSNEHGYLLANAFVSVLGECPPTPRTRPSGWSCQGCPLFSGDRQAGRSSVGLKGRFVGRREG